LRSLEFVATSVVAALETWVMDRQVKTNRWFFAVVACAALAAGASFAAEREGSNPAPKSGETTATQEGSGRLPDAGVAASKAGADTGGQNSGLAGNRNDAVNAAARPSAPGVATGRATRGGVGEAGPKAANAGGKSAAAPRGIDLVRPDDGYASRGLRRRATRSSLIAAGQKKKLQIVPTVAATSRPPSPASAALESLRNSAGVAMPAHYSSGKADSIHTAPASTAIAKNSLGMNITALHPPETHPKVTGPMPVVAGISGTTMGHAGLGGIGGPAKDRSGISGSGFRHKF
jgi:hypothetical protein